MLSLTVNLGERAYPIYIESGLLNALAEKLGQSLPANLSKVLIISDETVAGLYLQQARQFMQRLLSTAAVIDTATPPEIHDLVLPDGEQHKNQDSVNHIYQYLLQAKFDRAGLLIALGGGVVGDITGFAAATYQRGIAFLQIPTTLLAQVDSSVGGKTGINHPLGKNMIGAFHQPLAVFIDTAVLHTLPERELKAGLAEVIKYGLLGDAQFFDWLEEQRAALLTLEPKVTAKAVGRCCEAKARVVAADEKEAGQRALLNLGHTFGHAIETATGYGTYLHGEAVAMGMVMAADLSARLGLLSADAARRVRQVLEEGFGMPVIPPTIDEARYLEIMASDKKASGGRLRFVLLRAIGDAFVTADVEPTALSATLKARENLCS